MRRVLFVDDEPKVLRGIENVLFDVWETWEVVTADSGSRALEILEADRCDLLVTDMRMPGMDGLQLLEAVRERFPTTVTCVLSGHAEADAVLTAMVSAHRYLAKPANTDSLFALLDQVDSVLTGNDVPAVREQLSMGGEVPPRPALLSKVERLLRSGASFERVGAEVETDALVTARVLKVANSVFFRGSSPIRSVAAAITRIGLDTFETVFTQVTVTRSFPVDEMAALEAVHERLVAAGMLAREIAEGTDWQEQAHLAGMLHDVGRLIFMANGCRLLDDHGTKIEQAEREAFGVTHAQIAAHLFTLWGFDLDIIEAVARHHDLAGAVESGPGTRRATAIASALIDELDDPSLVPEHDRILGEAFDRQQLHAWRTTLHSKGAA